jgi:hypothetical protein
VQISVIRPFLWVISHGIVPFMEHIYLKCTIENGGNFSPNTSREEKDVNFRTYFCIFINFHKHNIFYKI